MTKIELLCECHANTAFIRCLLNYHKLENDYINQILEDNSRRLRVCNSGTGTSTLLKNLEPLSVLEQITKEQKKVQNKDNNLKPKKVTILQKSKQEPNLIKIVFCDLDENSVKNGKLSLVKNFNKYVQNNFTLTKKEISFGSTSLYFLQDSNSKNCLIYVKPAAERLIFDLGQLYGENVNKWGFPDNLEQLKSFCKNVSHNSDKLKSLDIAMNRLIQAGIKNELTTELNPKPLSTILDWLNI